MIPEEKIREVADRLSIVEVVGEYVALRRAGANYQGLCPFHGEKTPSFNVNPARNIYHCFGCGVGGNVFSFVMRMEGLTFPESVKFLAKRAGVTIEEQQLTPRQRQVQDEREQLLQISELAAGYFRQQLQESAAADQARRYLADRDVAAETAAAYRLGYAVDKWDGLVRFLERQRVALPLAEKLGLIRRGSAGGYVDLFRNRLIIPICDGQGRPIAFGGRILGEGQPKYLNSPESPVYHKSDVLFGLHMARAAMREQGAAIVVEGYFDHLALWQGGVKQVVATCGTALTEGHVQLLKRSAGRLYTLFDGDAAGQKATERVMDLVLGSGLPSSVVELPAGDDPDSFIRREGPAAFTARLGAAKPLFTWFLQRVGERTSAGTVEGKVAICNEIAPKLQKMSDPLERGLYVREIARRFGIDEQQIRNRLGRGSFTDTDFARPASRERQDDPEDLLLALIGRSPALARRVAASGLAGYFAAERQPLAAAIVSQLEESEQVDWSAVLDQASSDTIRNGLAAVLVDENRFAGVDVDQMFDELCASRARQGLKRIAELRRDLARFEAGSPRFREILTEIDALRNAKSQLL
jgi:DNA primase